MHVNAIDQAWKSWLRIILPGWNDARTFASDRIYACARQFTMNLRYAFNNCAFARVRMYSIGRITQSVTRIKRA